MISLLSLLTVFFLVVISIQDFKYRMIAWYYLAALLVIASIIGLHDNTFFTIFVRNTLINFLFVATQLSLVSIYFWIKTGKITKITDVAIGKGDLFFLAALCVMGSTINFFGAYILGLIASLFFTLVSSFKRPIKKSFEVPLAGCLAIMIIPFFLYKIFNPDFNMYNDYFGHFLLAWKH